jgi:hypothetical protein
VARDAATLFTEIGDHASAAACHELIGDEVAAAESYQRAGDLDKLESVLQREEQRRRQRHLLHNAYQEYRLALASGERDRALEQIGICSAAATNNPHAANDAQPPQTSYRRLYEQLAARLITTSVVTLRSTGVAGTRERGYAGVFPLLIGREVICHLVLRDAGISRQHAELILAAFDGRERFCLRDCASKNGTMLSGVRVSGTLSLTDDGEIDLGEHCTLRFHITGGTLALEVTRGLDRGRTLHARLGALDIDDVGDLEFVDGRPRLSAKGGRLLYLNGVQASRAVQLIRGDVVELGERRLEVID